MADVSEEMPAVCDNVVTVPADEDTTMSSVPSVDEDMAEGTDIANLPAPVTHTSSASDNPEKPKVARPVQETLHTPVTPADIIEYEWPLKSGERFFLQEQIAELLDVKSFKRKYAEMTRRIVEVPEKEYLQKTFASFIKTIGEHQMHGLTSLRSIEVHELMSAEYPDIYADYQRATVHRIKAELAEKQKELDAIKKDKTKLEELRKKAIQSAKEYNSELCLIKKVERKFFWDLQTSMIQSASNRWMVHSKERSRPHAYPCALIHGQYQHYYKKWTPAEMRRLPLNCVLDGHHLFTVQRPPSPSPIIVSEEELAMASMPSLASPGVPTHAKEGASTAFENVTPNPLKRGRGAPEVDPICGLCSQTERNVSPLLRCASCGYYVHSDCIDLPDSVVEVAQTYKWNCIDCKKCTICEKPDSEDKMMFCDRCDRGYHTFCVGLNQPPTGHWWCTSFCKQHDETPKKAELQSPPETPMDESLVEPSYPQEDYDHSPTTPVKEPPKKRARRSVPAKKSVKKAPVTSIKEEAASQLTVADRAEETTNEGEGKMAEATEETDIETEKAGPSVDTPIEQEEETEHNPAAEVEPPSVVAPEEKPTATVSQESPTLPSRTPAPKPVPVTTRRSARRAATKVRD